MAEIKMTHDLAHAAATDAGNRNMREHGRSAWNKEDYAVAIKEYYRLYPEEHYLRDLLESV